MAPSRRKLRMKLEIIMFKFFLKIEWRKKKSGRTTSNKKNVKQRNFK